MIQREGTVVVSFAFRNVGSGGGSEIIMQKWLVKHGVESLPLDQWGVIFKKNLYKSKFINFLINIYFNKLLTFIFVKKMMLLILWKGI